MTTPEHAALYAAQHRVEHAHRAVAVFNPNDAPIDSLPFIYGFNNGGSIGMLHAVAISEDGEHLGSHLCSDECYMPHDLGILEGTRPDRHEKDYRPHYPNGYRMAFVSYADVGGHEGIQRAMCLLREKQAKEGEQE